MVINLNTKNSYHLGSNSQNSQRGANTETLITNFLTVTPVNKET